MSDRLEEIKRQDERGRCISCGGKYVHKPGCPDIHPRHTVGEEPQADDVVPDRLAEIKAFRKGVRVHLPLGMADWLIGEVERLRVLSDEGWRLAELHEQRKLEADAGVAALRGALEALVDATEVVWGWANTEVDDDDALPTIADAEIDAWEKARAAAVALLAGPGGET